ncbi:MAG: DNA repair protein RadA, partial [Solirubrobacteraceae bacterium]
MPRTTVHVCSECGLQSAQWHGRCPGCEAWNTLVEERLPATPAAGRARAGSLAKGGGPLGGGAWAGANGAASGLRLVPRALRDVGAAPVERMSSGIGELDRVLGGGLVPGSLVLLGGSPGIGKSTLTNMVLGNLAQSGHRTLYVSGEESAEQVRLRAERLGRGALKVPILAETDLDAVLQTIAAEAPQVCVIDSVQTLNAAELSGAPGSVGQVREVAGRIMELAKARAVAVILVGHVTKEGALAGPRVLEHLVDCVLQFEGERERPYRELRALKNRFGSTNEAGLFEMRQGGLVEVLDASARFVAEATRAPGSVVLAAMEGSRPLLVEVQALVVRSELEQPRRVVSGLDRNRLALVLAILGRHGQVPSAGSDVFVNVVGGVRVDEPGCDLAVALAV